MYLNLLSDDFQIYWFLNDGIIIWVLLNEKGKLRIKAKSIILQITFYRRCSYHFGGKLLEQLADQTAGGLSVRHHSIEELLEDLFQAGRCTLSHSSGKETLHHPQ